MRLHLLLLSNMKRLSLLFIGILASYNATHAQIHRTEATDSANVSQTYNLNPIVVTGSGHHQRLKSTATPVHVLSAQDISEQGITTFDDALTRMMPQTSMAPNSMGSFLRLNGLGNKYILILIKVLDGAASSLYGSDAIGGVINIITDQPTGDLCSVTNTTKVSGHGILTESINLDIYTKGFGSYTSFTHDRADSYQNNNLEYLKGSDTETQPTIAPFFTGYRSSIVGQKFTYAPNRRLALNAGMEYSYKITNRPETRADITGGISFRQRTRCRPTSPLTVSAMARNMMSRPRRLPWAIMCSRRNSAAWRAS